MTRYFLIILASVFCVFSWSNEAAADDASDWSYAVSATVMHGEGQSWSSGVNRVFWLSMLNMNANYTKRHRFSISLPYMQFDYENADRIETYESSVSGLGDIKLGYIYHSNILLSKRTKLSLGGDIKSPTASSDKRLGTGEWDYNVNLKAQWFPNLFMSQTRLFFDMKTRYSLRGRNDVFLMRNGFSHGLGVNALFSKQVAGISYQYKQASSELSNDDQGVRLFWSGQLSESIRLLFHGYKMRRSEGVGLTLAYRI